MNLFQQGQFTLHSGDSSPWKIDCDALRPEDWATIAALIGPHLMFTHVEGVPSGGLRFAEALQPYRVPIFEYHNYQVTTVRSPSLLIVDDVWTTGASMEHHRQGRPAQGLVLFTRSTQPLLPWVTAVWYLNAYFPYMRSRPRRSIF